MRIAQQIAPTALISIVLLALVTAAADERATTRPDALHPAGESQIERLWAGDPPAKSSTDEGESISRGVSAGEPFVVLRNIRQASLGVFLPQGKGPFPAVIICPGGAYRMESITTEGHAAAQKFAAEGVAAFVLKYRLPEGQQPAEGTLPLPQQDLFRAIRLVRGNTSQWNIDPHRVGVMGFSAGGHLAATAATMFDQADAGNATDAVSQQPARPDFAVLVYPVISMTKPLTHNGSHDRLLGKNADPVGERRFDPSQHVTNQTPPLFIVHAADDGTVSPANSLLMIAAAEKAKVPHALLLLSQGGHGFGLGNEPESKGWSDQCLAWLRTRRLLD